MHKYDIFRFVFRFACTLFGFFVAVCSGDERAIASWVRKSVTICLNNVLESRQVEEMPTFLQADVSANYRTLLGNGVMLIEIDYNVQIYANIVSGRSSVRYTHGSLERRFLKVVFHILSLINLLSAAIIFLSLYFKTFYDYQI